MKIAFYCRVDGQGFGFVLPDEADKLREFFAEHQDKPVLDIRVPEIMHADYFQVIPLEKFLKVTGNIIIWLEQRSHVIDKHEIQIVCII